MDGVAVFVRGRGLVLRLPGLAPALLRRVGREKALSVAATMLQGRVINLDAGLAIEAAELGASHGLPLADSIIYASALTYEATLWTQDADFDGLDHVEYRPQRRLD